MCRQPSTSSVARMACHANCCVPCGPTVGWLNAPISPTDITDDFASDARLALHAWQNLTSAAKQCINDPYDKDPVNLVMEHPGMSEDDSVRNAYERAYRAYNDLFNTYGTHYINELNLGGKAVFIKAVNKSSYNNVRGHAQLHLICERAANLTR